jgi:peroxiredoxin
MKFINHRWKFVHILILVVSAGWIIFTSTTTRSNNPELVAPQAGFLAPDFSLVDTKGNTFTLSEHRGKAIILNLWASWCKPCQAEMPALEVVSHAYRSEDVLLVGVNATNQDNQTQALDFLTTNQITFPILFDTDGNVSRAYLLQALPTTFFIFPDGTIQEVITGGPLSEALLRSKIQILLGGK